ncbi:protein of unknown function [Candidatus Nitrotoga arctica]|uniref:Uncharacterized protein n=1 Tax=Candidatus Nitrotoga arctica TaxID=453162 RepID=A0ABM8YXY5_9PROT|nr:protein of unknown function [Candidatus Nitrotoga arctica]
MEQLKNAFFRYKPHDRNAEQESKSERRIDQFLGISTTFIMILASMFMLFVVVATTTDWLPWKIDVAHLLEY